jgi:Rrf2 family nitric oxide-sensitive transcriptional repressor
MPLRSLEHDERPFRCFNSRLVRSGIRCSKERRLGQTLNLSQGGEYALASLARLALTFPAAVPVAALARLQAVPQAFLSKILRRCARAGIVRAKRGPGGGVSLARAPERVAVLEVFEACEGEQLRSRCVFYAAKSCDGPACAIYCPLRRQEEIFRDGLRGATLADMARSLKDHPLNR